ncbi:MAG TPA: type II toxin-antitoxin system VapC family toxin [Solirubrobacteraceae bacterium]|nr:type II toxin-antitoxin system VapC family toxin [Solirubrobacteraceae bacterium]
MIETEGVVVVDASALVELVIEGEHRAGADALLDRYRTVDRLVLVSAAHGLIEATSAIRRLAQRGSLPPEQGWQSISWLGQIDLVLDATAPRLRRVWALREQMSAYDAAYAAAAEALDSPLISTDGRLLSACGSAGIQAAHLSTFAAS